MAFIAGAVRLVLVAFAAGYGYHRDELYFLAAGRHLDWGYADQGPLIPLIAHAMSDLARLAHRAAAAVGPRGGRHRVAHRTDGRELGGAPARAADRLGMRRGVGVIVLFTGHLLSTSTFDLLAGPR